MPASFSFCSLISCRAMSRSALYQNGLMLIASMSMPCASMAAKRSAPTTRVRRPTLQPHQRHGFREHAVRVHVDGLDAAAADHDLAAARRGLRVGMRRRQQAAAAEATPAIAPVMPPMKSLRVVISSSPCRIVFRDKYLSVVCARKGGSAPEPVWRRRRGEVTSCGRSGDGGARYAADAQRRQRLARCRHRPVHVDAATRIVDHHDVKSFPMRVLGRVADAEVEGEPGEEDPPQAALSKVPGQAGPRSAVVLVERR